MVVLRQEASLLPPLPGSQSACAVNKSPSQQLLLTQRRQVFCGVRLPVHHPGSLPEEPLRDKIQPSVDLDRVMPGYVSQSEEDECHMVSLTCGIQ